MTIPQRKGEGKILIKKAFKRLRKEFRFLFPVAIRFFFDHRDDTFIEIRFGTKGIFKHFHMYNREFFKKYKHESAEGILGDPVLQRKCSRVQILGRLHMRAPFHNFSTFKDFEDWSNARYSKGKKKSVVRIEEEFYKKLEEFLKERRMKMSDFLRSSINYTLWLEYGEVDAI